jgi:hypothetical protein
MIFYRKNSSCWNAVIAWTLTLPRIKRVPCKFLKSYTFSGTEIYPAVTFAQSNKCIKTDYQK